MPRANRYIGRYVTALDALLTDIPRTTRLPTESSG
jgi:hypothetical protein